MGFFKTWPSGPKKKPCSNWHKKKKSCMGMRVGRKKEENAEGACKKLALFKMLEIPLQSSHLWHSWCPPHPPLKILDPPFVTLDTSQEIML